MTTVNEAFARRRAPVGGLGADADRLAAACRAMARRFTRGGRLLAAGRGVSAADVAHVVVEFVHPVVVGTRALPALALPDGGSPGSVELFGEPDDVLLVFDAGGGPDPDLSGAVRRAVAEGLLTVVLTGGDGGELTRVSGVDHLLVVGSDDPRVVREAHVTVYHVLWELVHVFLAGTAAPQAPGAQGAGIAPDPHPGEVCITCSDAAVEVTVAALHGDGLALVDTAAGTREEVSVALVEAGIGDVVLVHAGEAIATVRRAGP